jgi:hypothetical protein
MVFGRSSQGWLEKGGRGKGNVSSQTLDVHGYVVVPRRYQLEASSNQALHRNPRLVEGRDR